MKDLKLKVGETIIPIESLKAIELGTSNTLIIETDSILSVVIKNKIENFISNKVCGKILILDGGLKATAIIKSGDKK